MDTPESKVHSFIVKLWLEEAGDEMGRTVWRGCITHVPGGERRYLKRLNDITHLIAQYLEESGVEPERQSRARRWLEGLGLRLTRRRWADHKNSSTGDRSD